MSKRERQLHMTLSSYESRALDFLCKVQGEISRPRAAATALVAAAVRLGFDDIAKDIFKNNGD